MASASIIRSRTGRGWILSALCIAGTPVCLAAPTITAVTGKLTDGQTVTVTGSGFGHGPNVIVFDDFESGNGRMGQPIPLTSPEIGKWSDYTSVGKPRYSPYARSGSHGFSAADAAFPDNNPRLASFTELLPGPATEVFMSYAFFIPPGTTFPGASVPGTLPTMSSLKAFWLFDGPLGFRGEGTSDLVAPAWTGGFWALGGNSGPVANTLGQVFGDWFSFQHWNHLSFWLKADAAAPINQPGTIFAQATNLDKGHVEHTWTDRSPFEGPTNNNAPTSGKWDRFTVPGWWGNGTNAHNEITYDDIYVAVGPNAAARLELGDAPSYEAARTLAISTPKTWDDNQIVLTLRTGPFAPGAQVYLYVIDANNKVSRSWPLKLAPMPSTPTDVTVK